MSSGLILTELDTVGWSKDLVNALQEMPTGRPFCIFVMAIFGVSFFMKLANHWRSVLRIQVGRVPYRRGLNVSPVAHKVGLIWRSGGTPQHGKAINSCIGLMERSTK